MVAVSLVWGRSLTNGSALSGALLVPEEAALQVVWDGWSLQEAVTKYKGTPKIVIQNKHDGLMETGEVNAWKLETA